MKILVAVDYGEALASALHSEGLEVVSTVAADAPARAAGDTLWGDESEAFLRAVVAADVLLLAVSRESITSEVVAMCDRAATRIVPVCADAATERLAATFGLEQPIAAGTPAWTIADVLRADPVVGAVRDPRGGEPAVIAVWGAAGAPGRSTIAIELAVELARGGRHVALVDADTHAPSMALALGLADEGPGFAAACRQAELGTLDARELTRISVPLGGCGVDVLTGINRPSRWPELSETRVALALAKCRQWADFTVIDLSSSLERDEEIVSDLDGPRRNAATIAALQSADLVVAVAGADPVGVARFLRGHSELRATIGATPVAVLANQVRPGALGIDARGQVRRALDRFAGIADVWFVPQDPRSADAALLAARPIADVAPRSPFTLALRRFVGEALIATQAPAQTPAAKSRRGARRRKETVGSASPL
jgi:MinD-like ATPase involved in chromosome partitioning or flagellar assembly